MKDNLGFAGSVLVVLMSAVACSDDQNNVASIAEQTGAPASPSANGSSNNAGTTPVDPERLPPGLQTFDRIHGGDAAEQFLSLCYIVEVGAAGGGVFEVLTLGSREEETERGREPYTYAQLRLVDSWYGPPSEEPVIRMYGGLSGGSITDSIVGMQVGERVGLLLVPPSEQNSGYYGVFSQGTFQGSAETGYTNGALFTDSPMSIAEVGAAVRTEHENPSANCPEVLEQPLAQERPGHDGESAPAAPPTMALPEAGNDSP